MVREHPTEGALLVVSDLGLGFQLDRQLVRGMVVPEVVLLEQRPVQLVAPRLDLLDLLGVDLEPFEQRGVVTLRLVILLERGGGGAPKCVGAQLIGHRRRGRSRCGGGVAPPRPGGGGGGGGGGGSSRSRRP